MCTYFDAQLCNLIRVLTFTSLQSSSSGSLSLYVTWVKGRDTKRAREHNECVCVCACTFIRQRDAHINRCTRICISVCLCVCITFVLTLIPFSCSRSTHALSTASQTRTFSIFSGILKYLNVLAVNNLLYIIFYILYLYVHICIYVHDKQSAV